MTYCFALQCWQQVEYEFDYCEACRDILHKQEIKCTICHGTDMEEHYPGAFSHCRQCLWLLLELDQGETYKWNVLLDITSTTPLPVVHLNP